MRKKERIKFQIKPFHWMSGILIFPFLIFLTVEVFSRIAQGDLLHYNREVYAVLSQTPFYWLPFLFTWAFLFPVLAVLLNFFKVAKQARRENEKLSSLKFIQKNILSYLFMLAGFAFLAFIAPHFIPFLIYGIN